MLPDDLRWKAIEVLSGTVAPRLNLREIKESHIQAVGALRTHLAVESLSRLLTCLYKDQSIGEEKIERLRNATIKALVAIPDACLHFQHTLKTSREPEQIHAAAIVYMHMAGKDAEPYLVPLLDYDDRTAELAARLLEKTGYQPDTPERIFYYALHLGKSGKPIVEMGNAALPYIQKHFADGIKSFCKILLEIGTPEAFDTLLSASDPILSDKTAKNLLNGVTGIYKDAILDTIAAFVLKLTDNPLPVEET
jgi:hypothetical protein